MVYLANMRSNLCQHGENDRDPSSTSIREPHFSWSNHIVQGKTQNSVNLLQAPNQRLSRAIMDVQIKKNQEEGPDS